MRAHRRRSGASAIEFALSLPIFLSIVFSIIEYGWVFFQESNVIASVRQGVRYAVTLQREGSCIAANEATDRVRTTLLGVGYSSSQVASASITQSCQGTGTADDPYTLRVSADVPYTPIIGLVPVPEYIHADMTMMLEDQS